MIVTTHDIQLESRTGIFFFFQN